MSTYTETLTLQAPSYRNLLMISTLVTLAHLIFPGSLSLALLTHILVIVCSVVAWLQRDSEPWVRRPIMLALGLLLMQGLLHAAAEWLALPVLHMLANPGISALLLACLTVTTVALLVPNERSKQRVGARATRQARRYTWLAYGATLASGLLLLLGSGVLSAAAAYQTLYAGVLALLVVLLLPVLWHTWRTRRADYLLASTAGAAGGLVLAQASAELAPLVLALPPVSPALHVPPTAVLWVVLVALSAIVSRRPVPAFAPVDMPDSAHHAESATPSLVSDYISLTKPKVISLLLVTTLAAMFLTGEGLPSWGLVFWTMLGGYLAAGGANALNCAFDKDIDINMGRTSKRPVPSGRISPQNALLFGLTLCVLSFGVLFFFTTPLAAVLALLGIVYYALLYTRWLKRNTWQNIVLGGGAGALPPLVGWAAVTGSLDLAAIILFLIIFYWTPPHFWALALVKEKDYARAGVPMLPVVAGERETRWQIVLYSALMFGVTLLLVPLGAMGWIYLLLAIVLGVLFLHSAWQVWHIGNQQAIWGLYKYSLLYLALLFGAMVLDRLLL
jgi:protoheme IX farnesyltransferase